MVDAPVSVAPPPTSKGPPVSISPEGVRLRWVTLRRAAPWILTVLGFTGCSVTGFFAGLRAEAAVIAGMGAAIGDLRKRSSKLETVTARHEERLDDQANALQAEATSNRAERATAAGKLRTFAEDLEKVKQSVPKIQGLAKPSP